MKQGSMVKRTLAALLCLMMVLSCVPGNLFTAYAAEADDTLWKAYGENDTTTKGAWNTAYGTYDAVLLGYNYTGAVTAGKRTVFQGKNFTNMGAYCVNNKVSVTLPNTNAEHYTYGVTEETETNPPSETLYNPNANVTAQFDAYYLGGTNRTIPGADELPTLNIDTYTDASGVVQPGWDRVFFTFTGLEDDQEYLFRVYTNNNVSGYYKAKDFEDLKVHFVEDDGTVHAGVEAIQSNTFNGGAYRAYKVKGNFTVVFDRKLTYNGKLDRAAAAGYWGPSGFFFDEFAEPEALPENVFPESLLPEKEWKFVETDTTTKGAWNTAYGTYDAVLLGYNYTGAVTAGNRTVFQGKNFTNMGAYCVNNKVSVTLPNDTAEHFAYGITGEESTNPPSETLYNPNANVTAQFDAYYLGGTNRTIPGASSLPTLNNDTYTDASGVVQPGWDRVFFTFTGLEDDQYYLFRVYTNNNVSGYYKAKDFEDLKVHFVEDDGTVHAGVEAIQSNTFNGGVYRTYLVKGSFTVVFDRKLTYNGKLDRAAAAGYWGPSGFFFDEYEAPLTKKPVEEAETVALWSQVGSIDKTTGGAWETKGYGEEQAVLLGWQNAADTNTNVTYTTYNNLIYDCDKATMKRGQGVLHVRDDSAIVANLNTKSPEAMMAVAATRTDANGNLIANLDAPEGYTGETPKYNTYPWGGYTASNKDDDVLTSVKLIAEGTTYRNGVVFSGLDADKEYIFTVYCDTDLYRSVPTGKVVFSFWSAAMNEVYNSVETTSGTFSGGGYMSFKVKGNFVLFIDKADRFFGPSAFFFDECAVAEELTPPVWKFVDTDTTTKGAWNTAGYGSYDAALLGYNYTGAVTAGTRTAVMMKNYGVNGAYYPNSRVNVALSSHTEHYVFGVTDEAGKNPSSETLHNPNANVTAQFDVFYTAATADVVVTGTEETLGTCETGWWRQYYTFTGLDDDQYYIFRYYSNNNMDIYYSDVYEQNDLNIHFVEDDGTVHKNVEYVQSRSFDGGVYRAYLVKGNFTLVIDKKIYAPDSTSDAHTRSAKFWSPSGFFFDEYKAPAQDKVEYTSITLDGTIGVNYGVNLNLIAKQDPYAKMVLSHARNDDKVAENLVILASKVKLGNNKLQWFSRGVAAKEMADFITAQMHYYDAEGNLEGTGEAKPYSVKQYAETVLCMETDDTKIVKLQELLVRMLNYGAFAQTYFGYNTENPANGALSTTAKNSGLKTVLASQLKPYVGKCNVGSGEIQMSDASLLLKSETTLRLFFNKADVQGMKFEYNGNALKTNTRGSYTYVDITNIAAAKLDDVFTVEIKNGETVVSTVTYCPLAYVYSAMSQSDDANLINAVKSLYLYNQAANEYFALVGGAQN